jgi:hypothetical protein
LRCENTEPPQVRFGSKADIARCQADVRFTPQKQTSLSANGMSALCQKQTSAELVDHVVGAGEQ